MCLASQIAAFARRQHPGIQAALPTVVGVNQQGVHVRPTPLRVALVDDDDDLRAMVALSLRLSHGCEMLSCASAEQALRELPGFRPDVIVLDYMMPNMDGFQTLQALSGRMDLQDTKVVMTSAALLPERDCLARGATAILAKPFDAMGLGEYLMSLCRP
jgi:two-component system OmpR family response regulator